MTTEKYLPYRGDVKAAAAIGDTLVFVTAHPEGQPTALYRLDTEKFTLTAEPLPRGGVALAVGDDSVWVAGDDHLVYRCPTKGGAPKPLGKPLPAAPVAVRCVAGQRLAVLAGTSLVLLAGKDGKVLQTLDLPEPGTCLAVDPGGHWLAVGTERGTVAVFEDEGKPAFQLSESARLHEGAVTTLLFELEELRFLSAGADQKLLSTHARGKLEPEDRGRGNNHTDLVTALVWGPGDRFFSGSRDSTLKTWPRSGGARPATQKDSVGRVVCMALVPVQTRPHLAVACDDNTLRFFLLDPTGKFGDLTHRVHDAYAAAKHELGQDETPRREAALRALASYADSRAIDLLSERVGTEGNHGLRLLATQLLAESAHPRAGKLLEKWLGHADEAVRLAAFQGLRRHLGEQDLRPLDLALRTDKADVGRAAVQALEALARHDDQALARLTNALNARNWEVQQAALTSLEKVHDAQSPEADLVALGSKHADLRRLGLVRLFQRKLLAAPRVPAALRRAGEDADAEVRRIAFLLVLLTREKLAQALRARDAEIHRQLSELEAAAGLAPARETKPPKAPAQLAEADRDPLVQATASRALDTCLRGARGLAVLGDVRAFGLLLQLSREESAPARAEVCRALAALDDPRSVQRLRSLIYDADAAVRDAAFSALAHLHAADPLLAAEAGLNAAYEDVRRRGLQALVAVVRATPPRSADDRAWQLLERALNDTFPGVRTEAFKAALNLKVGGGGVQTLRFVLQSIHADVRREVLTETMAQAQEPWAWNLLLEFFNDRDPTLRAEAFAFAVKKVKDLPPLEAALRSQYADVRRQAVDALVSKHTPAAQALLARAVRDSEKEVRLPALTALVNEDARAALTEAMASPHADVRAVAATALARHGVKETLPALLALASAPEPPERERQADWARLVEIALGGLAELGDSAALPQVLPLLESRLPALRKAAARALASVALPHHVEALRQVLQHADPQVKYRAALGLAHAGDPLVTALVFSEPAAQVLGADERLIAAFTLQAAGEDQLAAFLDDADETLRTRALLLLLLRERKAHQGSPVRCLACLSSKMPRVRLTAARALEAFADPAAFRQFVVELFNDRGDEPAWHVPAETVDAVAELLVHGAAPVRVRTAELLQHLARKEQAAWDQAWAVHASRFAAAIVTLREQAAERPPVASRYTGEQLQQLAFGAYVGLVREQGSADSTSPHVVRVRQTALARVLALAQGEANLQAARLVCVQALGDPNQPVRLQAFEQLRELGMDRTALAAEALEVGHTDLGVRGLELLTSGVSAAEAQTVLEQVMLTRKDDLALEAARLLAAQRGQAAVAARALAAASEPLRQRAVEWLAAAYDQDPAAREALHRALASRYGKVREVAALELAGKKDPAAFDALVQLLQTATEAARQRVVLGALVTLGDPRGPDAFLDRLENDPGGTAQADELLRAAGSFRRPETASRLLALAEKQPRWRSGALAAVLTISGHDQAILDRDDEQPDRAWEEKQFPRHDALLARLLESGFRLGDTALLQRLVPAARWARGPDVDPVLAQLTAHPDDRLRRDVVAALGWRLRKRKALADPVVKVLGHKDSLTQFLAAEALAKAGRTEGLNVLLAAIDFLNDVSLRQRAVAALGELADPRALDTLLKLAGEEGHALQQAAAEAVGHLGQTEKGEEIFKLLERLARGEGDLAAAALRGLRWLNTHAGWQLLRQRALDPTCRFRAVAVEQLGYNDDPATRDLLLQLMHRADNGPLVLAAWTSARRLWGTESLEPDYALVQASAASYSERFREALRRVGERGDPACIFTLLPACPREVQDALATSLLHRAEVPLEEARRALGSSDARTVQLAAQVLGRAGTAARASASALETALRAWRTTWEQRRQRMIQTNTDDDELSEQITPCLCLLVWAAGRLAIAGDLLQEMAAAHADDNLYRPVRREVVTALAERPPTAAAAAALEAVALGSDPEARVLAAEALGRHRQAAAAPLAAKLLADRPTFDRLVAQPGIDVGDTLRSAVGQVHYQGVVLRHVIARGDVATLASVAANRTLPEATRLGALEGLGKTAAREAEAELLRLGQAKDETEEVRKAAWRALRRSRRARAAREVAT